MGCALKIVARGRQWAADCAARFPRRDGAAGAVVVRGRPGADARGRGATRRRAQVAERARAIRGARPLPSRALASPAGIPPHPSRQHLPTPSHLL